MKLYFKYLSMHIKAQAQYKSSFLLTLLGQFLGSFSAFIGIYFLMERFNKVEGFTFSQILLCFATVQLSISLAECFMRGFDAFSGLLSNGEFDRMMVRPRGLVFQVAASKIEFSRLGKLVQAIIVFAYALPASGIAWTAGRALTLLGMIAGGVSVFTGLFLIYASLCFFTTEGLEFINIFTDGGREFGSYPFVIYGKAILGFFTYVIPLALIQYYPLLYLLGMSQNPLYMLLPLLGLVFLLPCYGIWRIGLRHYRSIGS